MLKTDGQSLKRATRVAAKTLSPCLRFCLLNLSQQPRSQGKMERRREHQSSNLVSRVEGLLRPPHAQVEPSRYFPCLPVMLV